MAAAAAAEAGAVAVAQEEDSLQERRVIEGEAARAAGGTKGGEVVSVVVRTLGITGEVEGGAAEANSHYLQRRWEVIREAAPTLGVARA